MTGSFHGLSRWLEGTDPNGRTSLWFIIKRPRIWDYRWLHSSIPFFEKKRREICLIPLSGSDSEGAQGWLASITGLKKHRTYGTRRSPGPGLRGRRPVGQRTRGAGSDRAEGDATWPQITAVSGDIVGPPACVGSSHGKREEGAENSLLTLDYELQSQHSSPLLPTTSSPFLTALTDSSQRCMFAALSLSTRWFRVRVIHR